MYAFDRLPLVGSGNGFWLIGIAIVAYLLGSCLFSHFAGKKAGVDITKQGSGNPGTSNVLRVLGKGAAAATLAGDVLKGTLAVCLGLVFGGGPGMLLGAAFVIIGHCYPVFFGFKGGKAVATTAGAMAVLDFQILLIVLSLFILILMVTRYISVSSVSAGFVGVIAAVLLGQDTYMITLWVMIAVFIAIKHRTNFKRLAAGTENKISFRKK